MQHPYLGSTPVKIRHNTKMKKIDKQENDKIRNEEKKKRGKENAFKSSILAWNLSEACELFRPVYAGLE